MKNKQPQLSLADIERIVEVMESARIEPDGEGFYTVRQLGKVTRVKAKAKTFTN